MAAYACGCVVWCAGIIMLFWIWERGIPRRQKLGILCGIACNLTVLSLCACVCVLCVCCSRQPFVLSPLSSLLSHLSPLASLSSLLSPLADGDDQAAGTDARTRGARRPSRRRRRSPQLVAASSQERGGGAGAPSRRTQRTRGREAPRLGG